MAVVHAGWKTDPTHRHDLRYWDGRHWTPWVRDCSRPREPCTTSRPPRVRIVRHDRRRAAPRHHPPAPRPDRPRAGRVPLVTGVSGALLALVAGPEVVAVAVGSSGWPSELFDFVRLSAIAFLVLVAASLGVVTVLATIPLRLRASDPVVQARAGVARALGLIALLPMTFIVLGGLERS